MNIIILSILMAISVIAISIRYVISKAREVDKQLDRPDLIELEEYK